VLSVEGADRVVSTGQVVSRPKDQIDEASYLDYKNVGKKKDEIRSAISSKFWPKEQNIALEISQWRNSPVSNWPNCVISLLNGA
jgi:hypothetical protein